MKIALLYNGQGSQKEMMGKELYENSAYFKEVIDSFEEFKVKELMMETKIEELSKTKNTQVALLGFEIAVNQLLKKEGITPDFVAGLSLGEYAALEYSEVLDKFDLMKIIRFRGLKMEEACLKKDAKMAAVLGLDRKVLDGVISEYKGDLVVSVANYNTDKQQVIAGHIEAVNEVSLKVLERGAKRVIELPVSGAFHTELMASVSKDLEGEFLKYNFKEQKVPVVFNLFGKTSSEDILEILVKQVKSAVYFEDSIRFMIEQGVDTFVEIGPNKVLSSFVRKIDSSVKILSISDYDSYLKTIDVIKGER